MNVEMPDGTIIEDVPDGTTQTEIQSRYAKLNPEPTDRPSIAKTAFDSVQQGLSGGFMDEATSALAAPVISVLSGNGIKGTPQAYDQAMGIWQDELKKQREDSPYISGAGNVAGGVLGAGALGATKAGGVVASGLRNGMVRGGSLAARAANLFSKAALGSAAGSASGAITGAGMSEPNNRGEGAKTGAIYGGIIGGALPVAASGIASTAKALTPAADEGLVEVGKLAQKYNVPVSVDQLTTSKPIKSMQKVSQELPFAGQAQFRQKQIDAVQGGLLKTVGVEGKRFTPQVMDDAFTQVGKKFDDLGKGKTFRLDTFKDDIKQVISDAEATTTKDSLENLNKALERVYKNVNPDGTISGEKLSFLRSNINGLARKAGAADTKEVLHQLENAVIDVMTEGDDVAKGALSQAKQQYKNLLVLEPLASKAKGGNINPTQLQARVQKIYGRQYTRGKAGEIGDLARIGYELLPELGGSDTSQKLFYGGGAIAAMANAPVATTAAIAANRAAQSGLNRNQNIVRKMLDTAEQKLISNKTNDALKITIRPQDKVK